MNPDDLYRLDRWAAGDDVRATEDRAAEARHGGRYITTTLAGVVERYPHLRPVLGGDTLPESPYLTLSDVWQRYLSPSGSNGNGADTTARIARLGAEGRDVFGNGSPFILTLAAAEAMMDWPIYRAAMIPIALDSLPLARTHPCHAPGCDTGSTVDHQSHGDPVVHDEMCVTRCPLADHGPEDKCRIGHGCSVCEESALPDDDMRAYHGAAARLASDPA